MELRRLGHKVTGLERDAVLAERYIGSLTTIVHGDGSDPKTIRDMKVAKYKIAIVAIGSSIEGSVLAAANLVDAGVQDIWAKANNAPHGRIAERVGAHHVVYPEADMGERVAHLVTGKMIDFIEFDDGFAIAKTRAPMETRSPRVTPGQIDTSAPMVTSSPRVMPWAMPRMRVGRAKNCWAARAKAYAGLSTTSCGDGQSGRRRPTSRAPIVAVCGDFKLRSEVRKARSPGPASSRLATPVTVASGEPTSSPPT